MSWSDFVNDYEKGYFEIAQDAIDALQFCGIPSIMTSALHISNEITEDTDSEKLRVSLQKQLSLGSAHLIRTDANTSQQMRNLEMGGASETCSVLPGNSKGPGIVNTLLDRTQYSVGTRVVLVNMEKSKYRSKKMNETTGIVENYDVTTRRHLVYLDDVVDCQTILWCRSINLEPLTGVGKIVHAAVDGPHPKLVEVLKQHESKQT